MTGKIMVILLIVVAAVGGGAMYYLQTYGYYYEVTATPGQDVVLVRQDDQTSAPINYRAFQAIDADSSPIRYRACFQTDLTRAELDATYVRADKVELLTSPGWFDCFDEAALAEALDQGIAQAYLGVKNVHFGVDRIVAITDQGRGYVWHLLNDCGEKAYDGTVVGEECPPRPTN